MRKKGSHQKMMFSSIRKIISTMKAQMVMMGMENEQIMPSPSPLGAARSPSMSCFNPFTRLICLPSWSEIMKATPLSYFRSAAGVVSMGNAT